MRTAPIVDIIQGIMTNVVFPVASEECALTSFVTAVARRSSTPLDR